MSKHYDPAEFAGIELKGDEADPAAIVTKALEGLQGSLDKRLAEIEAKSVDRLDKLEAKLNRPAIIHSRGEAKPVELKAFEGMLRRGAERMSADEQKALVVSTDTSGGFLVPQEYGNELLKNVVLWSPIRSYARTVTIGGQSIVYPKLNGRTAATWTGETAARTESSPTFTDQNLPAYELSTFVDVSNQLLEDNQYNLLGELAQMFGEDMGKVEGAAFVNGTGTGQPTGLLTSTAITNTVITGAASNFPNSNPADILIKMQHALPAVIAQNAVWMMNRATLGTVRQWKDAQGRYLVLNETGPNGAPLTTLLGRPVVDCVDFPNVAANALPIVFGDLQGYRIVDRVGLSTLRDPFTQASVGKTRFYVRKRVGADVTHGERFVALKVSAT
jgi:HK97 family phage major capsid protein